jgi:hypothetical protein
LTAFSGVFNGCDQDWESRCDSNDYEGVLRDLKQIFLRKDLFCHLKGLKPSRIDRDGRQINQWLGIGEKIIAQAERRERGKGGTGEVILAIGLSAICG